jgi:hypothetical protein
MFMGIFQEVPDLNDWIGKQGVGVLIDGYGSSWTPI